MGREVSEGQSELRLLVSRPSTRPLGMGMPRPAWVRLNRLRTGVGDSSHPMHKWGLVSTPICESGKSDQTAAHVILECPLHGAPRVLVQNDETRC